jgi:hypothetical protein
MLKQLKLFYFFYETDVINNTTSISSDYSDTKNKSYID